MEKKGIRGKKSQNRAEKEKISQKPGPKVLIIVQARMSSTRLPGKVLLEAGGFSLLAHLIHRLKQVVNADQLVVATSKNASDDPIEQACNELSIACFRGDLENVLDRYYACAKKYQGDLIVRITADCPLIDPFIVSRVIETAKKGYPLDDYVSNTLERTFPKGMDTEVFTFKALSLAKKEAATPYELEHVTPYFYTHPELFKLKSVIQGKDQSSDSYVVDTLEDFKKIKKIIENNPAKSLK